MRDILEFLNHYFESEKINFYELIQPLFDIFIDEILTCFLRKNTAIFNLLIAFYIDEFCSQFDAKITSFFN